MKKLIFNQARTKIFNLDQIVCVERIDCSGWRGIMLYFADNIQFFVTYSQEAMDYIEMRRHDAYRSLNPSDNPFLNGNHEINKKLFQYFENKFLKSALCQKGTHKNED